MRIFIMLLFTPVFCYSQTTFELNTGSTRTGIDLIYSSALDSAQHWLLLSRNIASADYNKTTSIVSFNSIAYAFKSGIGVTSNIFFTKTGAYTCIGLQYILRRKNVFIYIYLTMKPSRSTFSDNFIFVAWQPPLNNKIKLLLQSELNTSLTDESEDVAFERIKLGLNFYSKLQVGVMTELSTHSSTNTGIFLKKLL